MSQAPNVIKRDLPYVHDLDAEQLLSLQRDAAERHGLDVVFHDPAKAMLHGPTMVVIPRGLFEMGAPRSEFGFMPEEGPQHYVGIDHDFAIGKYVVTAAEFEIFRQAIGWSPRPELIWAKEDYPVINVRIEMAEAYIDWLNDQTGQRYRLPSEAEWEYAARAGSLTPFCFGDSVSCKEVHFNAAFPYEEAKQEKRWFLPRCFPMPKAVRVGSKPASLWGLHEVHGNVWEMTASAWTNSHHDHRRDGQATDLPTDWYVTKGGSWFDAAIWSRSAARKPRLRDEMDVNLGFRLLRELD